jgi:predicted metal-dependent hydrolase
MRRGGPHDRIKEKQNGINGGLRVSFWFLLQCLLNLVLLAGVVAVWIRMNRPSKDDPRLSKGLQLLQSKIAVLEDLSDRTETQVNQMTALLEQKCRDIQNKIQSSEKQLAKIEQSMQKSLEVAKIFQDRIPHTEILERQNTIKYVKAARLAHQGLSVEEIAQQVDLSTGEIEFIAKVNRDQLMFCEESLPEWAEDSAANSSLEAAETEENEMTFGSPLKRESPIDMSAVFEVPRTDQNALKKLGDAFKAACDEAAPVATNTASNFIDLSAIENTAPAAGATKAKESATAPNVRPVQFRRIDMTRDLG